MYLYSFKNGDFFTKKRRIKQKNGIFLKKKIKTLSCPIFLCHLLVLPENYTKINKYDGFQGQNPWKIMFFGQNGGSFLATVWWWYTYFRLNQSITWPLSLPKRWYTYFRFLEIMIFRQIIASFLATASLILIFFRPNLQLSWQLIIPIGQKKNFFLKNKNLPFYRWKKTGKNVQKSDKERPISQSRNCNFQRNFPKFTQIRKMAM